ncbi:glucosamine-6-phosphate deaminase [Mycoplasma sp. 1654_15]|uniref:glucosamine-6-phosphate deaminase n=1 Tax=Mycoplasma sp. 1654_15 TaxID=2725994 RepID=UPI001449D944|nr:glucosamine-6-phosphate deaminase [Mycoplasma sp. 1654_15]QJB71020.1 glucosamine-6-phosphate deaminase [Mycoplasma sp. 1654_15]
MIKKNIKVFDTATEANEFLLNLVTNKIKHKLVKNLGLPTGSTPIEFYKLFANKINTEKIDVSQITTFNLDEYYRLDPKDEQSYHFFMFKHLFSKVKFKANNFPKSGKYDSQIKQAGGLDLLILGVGNNGHIAFNEPGSLKSSQTRIIDLSPETIQANSRFFKSINEVPKKAITMGIDTIFKAKQIVVLAFGPAKKKALEQFMQSTKFDPQLPISALLNHPNTIILTDQKL